MLPIIHHPDYRIPLRPGHRFPMSKYGYLREALERRGLIPEGAMLAPSPATSAQISLAHDPDYVNRVFDGALTDLEVRRIGLPGNAKVTRRARLATAGTMLATWMALEHGIAANTAGGSHHAGPEGGAGFCVFNDVAVAALAVLDREGPSPILIIDADVHQGDGTARIFANEPRVFCFSIHAEKNYPAEKPSSDLDIGLPDGTGDADYLAALSAGLKRAMDESQPALVFYNAGVDVWEGDRLGRLALTSEGVRARDRLVIETVRGASVPLVGAIGGGYDDDPERLANHHAILFEEAARVAGA